MFRKHKWKDGGGEDNITLYFSRVATAENPWVVMKGEEDPGASDL